MTKAEASGWIVSPGFDLALFSGPGLLAVLVAFTVPAGAETTMLLWLLLVVCVDVAHVYGSLYRGYLDPSVRAQHGGLLVAAPLGALAGSALLWTLSSALFWTVLAYVAAFHFVRQQVGFVALYRVRQGLPVRSRDALIERAAVYAVTGFPLLWWHVHLPRSFDWFVPGDFLVGLPAWTLWPAGAVTVALVVVHVASRLRSGVRAPGRDLWVLTTGLVWFTGIVWTNGDLAFTATNILLHGVPYMALVLWLGRRQWDVLGVGPARRGLFRGVGLGAALLLLVALALAEEALWDMTLWGEHTSLFGAWSSPAWLAAVLVPVLAVPQVTHYVLDAFLWKLPNNPELAQVLGRGHAAPRSS